MESPPSAATSVAAPNSHHNDDRRRTTDRSYSYYDIPDVCMCDDGSVGYDDHDIWNS